MDCFTYRRIKLATPRDARPDVIAHVRSCHECAAFTRQLDTFEQNMHSTLHVPVADGLAEKIILRSDRPHWFKAAWLPAAAVIMLTVTAIVTCNLLPSRDDFAQQFVNHVLSEPEAFAADRSVEQAALRLALASFGGQMVGDIGDVKYLEQRRIGGVASTQHQISTRSGDVTLLLRPGRRTDIETPEVHQGHAIVIAAVPRGSLVIVAATPRQASEIRSLVLARTKFSG